MCVWFRIWACLRREEGVIVRTLRVITSIKTDINLNTVQPVDGNSATNLPRKPDLRLVKRPSAQLFTHSQILSHVFAPCVRGLQASDEVDVGSEVLIDPSQSLCAAQKELQRQSTVSVLRCCLQFPESETEVQDIFNLIQQLNASRESEERDNGWPTFYEPAATRCALCHYPLLKGEHR